MQFVSVRTVITAQKKNSVTGAKRQQGRSREPFLGRGASTAFQCYHGYSSLTFSVHAERKSAAYKATRSRRGFEAALTRFQSPCSDKAKMRDAQIGLSRVFLLHYVV